MPVETMPTQPLPEPKPDSGDDMEVVEIEPEPEQPSSPCDKTSWSESGHGVSLDKHGLGEQMTRGRAQGLEVGHGNRLQARRGKGKMNPCLMMMKFPVNQPTLLH
jgi:hypothetical protein